MSKRKMAKVKLEDLRRGRRLTGLYREHGKRNILTLRKGVIDRAGVGENGLYVTIADEKRGGEYRTFLIDEMHDVSVSD